MAEKDYWNSRPPRGDARYAAVRRQPELAGLLPVLYPGVFPNLKAYNKPRADLDAILLTGIPSGVVPGFQNFTGGTRRTCSGSTWRSRRRKKETPRPGRRRRCRLPERAPDRRRRGDHRAQGHRRPTIPLVDPSFTPDAAAAAVDRRHEGRQPALLKTFPYLGLPGGGYETMPGKTKA